MIKIIIASIGVLVLLFGGLLIYSQSTMQSDASVDAYSTTTPDLASMGLTGGTGATNGQVTPEAAGANTAAPINTNQKIMTATLHTNMGDITIEFFPNQAPNTVANFIKLAQAGFYDGTKFHRVIKGFMDQGGDPLTKDDSQMARWGTGGPGYQFNDEVSSTNSNAAGTIAMANSGPNTQGSQFFINAVDNHSLDSGYTVFGKVTSGMSVVTAINNTPTDSSDRPLTPVVLKSVTLK